MLPIPWLGPPITTMQYVTYFRFCWRRRFNIIEQIQIEPLSLRRSELFTVRCISPGGAAKLCTRGEVCYLRLPCVKNEDGYTACTFSWVRGHTGRPNTFSKRPASISQECNSFVDIADITRHSDIRILTSNLSTGNEVNKAIIDCSLRPQLLYRRPPTNGSTPHIVIANALVRNLLPLNTTTKSNSVAQPGEYIGNLWLHAPPWLWQILPVPHAVGPTMGNMTSSTKPEVHNVFHCRQTGDRATAPDITYRKFREVSTCGFWDTLADTQTYRHAHRHTSHVTTGSEVKEYNCN